MKLINAGVSQHIRGIDFGLDLRHSRIPFHSERLHSALEGARRTASAAGFQNPGGNECPTNLLLGQELASCGLVTCC